MRRSVLILYWCLATAFAELAQDISRIETYIARNKKVIKKRYRPRYHIASPMGWLNDPSGFTYFGGRYHIFYQFHPFNTAWGPMHWGHVVSEDLINWAYYPVALVPEEDYELNGCLSGSAVSHENFLLLFYTGNSHTDNSTKQTQNIAVSTDGIVFQKYLYNPIIRRSDPRGTWEFRHPKVWSYNCHWYMVVGGQTLDKRGRISMYSSSDLYTWRPMGVLAESLGDMGYIWENPDFFELDGYSVLLISAHGIQSDSYKFRNLYQTGYVVGKYFYETGKFEQEISTATFNELDHGHDFYAAHSMLAPDGRRLVIAWMGMWEGDFEESSDGWAGMMTVVRELTLSSDLSIISKPVRELEQLRGPTLISEKHCAPGMEFQSESKSFELLVNATNLGNEVMITFWLGNGRYYNIGYLSDRRVMTVDRGGIDGVRRAYWHPDDGKLFWRIFVDASSIEVFCGIGNAVFSSRIYPHKKVILGISGDTPVILTQYHLRKSVGNSNEIISRKFLKEYYPKGGKKPKKTKV